MSKVTWRKAVSCSAAAEVSTTLADLHTVVKGPGASHSDRPAFVRKLATKTPHHPPLGHAACAATSAPPARRPRPSGGTGPGLGERLDVGPIGGEHQTLGRADPHRHDEQPYPIVGTALAALFAFTVEYGVRELLQLSLRPLRRQAAPQPHPQG